jgi:predicted GIY-YIG superfamily endonuclease
MLGNASIQSATRRRRTTASHCCQYLSCHERLKQSIGGYWVASQRNGTFYIGETSHLALRAHQHRSGVDSTVQGDVRRENAGLVGALRRRQRCDRPREAIEAAGTRVEARADRAFQSGMGRPLRTVERLIGRVDSWIPAFAGMTGWLRQRFFAFALASISRRALRRRSLAASGSFTPQLTLGHPGYAEIKASAKCEAAKGTCRRRGQARRRAAFPKRARREAARSARQSPRT